MRKKQPQIVTDIEKYLINKYLKKLKSSNRYLSDIKGKNITVFESTQNIDGLKALFERLPFGEHQSDSCIIEKLEREITYKPMMRFILEDKQQRIFIAQCFCFKGSVDDWIYIGGPDSLENLLKAYFNHLGQESFYGLY
ncbi:MAG: hypothetical protein J7K30_15115 [Deltaproteobacteria bacterium]|nr:hypothetical protein [Deltaproteobacteria bacterium]